MPNRKEIKYCEVVIYYNKRNMPLTSLVFLKADIKRILDGFTPKLKVRTEAVK